MRTRAQRPHLPEVSESQRKARQAWNGGKTGKPRPASLESVIDACAVDGCGSPAAQPQPVTGMVRVQVSDSREPARWYCPGRCAAIGRARADLATITPGGDA